MNHKVCLVLALAAVAVPCASAQESVRLTGTVIGTEQSFDYDNNTPSTTVNSREMAFDGDVNTFFASNERDHTWVGLDLGTPHIITSVGWSPRNDNNVGAGRMVLGLFEGANSADFSDAVPLYIIPDAGIYGVVSYADVKCGKGFRYVRYQGPSDVRCNVAEVEFYGYEGEGSDDAYATLTNLPVVVVNTENGDEPQGKEKADEKKSVIKIISPEGELLSAPGTLRLRGNASMGFEKKPYRIKFDKKQKPLDAKAKAKKWTLINNYGDKTLMRNLVAWEIARLFDMEYVPYGRAVDVVVNGEYKGCYQFCDQIEVKEGRVPIAEVEVEGLTAKAPEECDYLMEIDGYAGYKEPYVVPENFKSAAEIPVTLKSPDPDDIRDAKVIDHYSYARDTFQAMEDAVLNNAFPATGYRELLDVKTFLKHFLIGEITCNPDTYWSTYIYKRSGDSHFYFGPEWDFDIAFDNDYRVHDSLYTKRFMYSYGTPAGSNEANGWSVRTYQTFVGNVVSRDPDNLPFAKHLLERAMERGLTAEHLGEYIDNLAAELDASQALNFKRWKILDQNVHMNVGSNLRSTYGEYVDLLKSHLTRRLDFLYNTSFGNIESGVWAVEGQAPAILAGEGRISVSGADRVTVSNLSGITIYSGTSGDILLAPGLYIVKADNLARKALVR